MLTKKRKGLKHDHENRYCAIVRSFDDEAIVHHADQDDLNGLPAN